MAKLVSCIQKKRIAVIGDVMTDLYIEGSISACQDGCHKFIATDVTDVPGGAANAARSLSNWDCEVQYFGAAVEDASVKTRFSVAGKIVLRYDSDKLVTSDGLRYSELWKLKNWSPDAILVSDYDKGFLSPHILLQLLKHPLVVVDAKRPPEVYQGATVLKGNSDYAARYSGVTVITDGASPPWVRSTRITHFGRSVPCVNHVGAGDCFSAHLTLALANGYSLSDAAALAHSAGRVYVQHKYNRPPLPQEIAEDLDSRD